MSYVPISYQRYSFPNFTRQEFLGHRHAPKQCPVHNTLVSLETIEDYDLGKYKIKILKYGRCCGSGHCGYPYNYYLVNGANYEYLGTEIIVNATELPIKTIGQVMTSIHEHTLVENKLLLMSIFAEISQSNPELLIKLSQIQLPVIELRKSSSGLKITFFSNPKNVYDFVLELMKIRQAFNISNILLDLQKSKVKFNVP